MSGPTFAAGQVWRNRHTPNYTVTLVRPGGDYREPAWFMEPRPSHGKYVVTERHLRQHYELEADDA